MAMYWVVLIFCPFLLVSVCFSDHADVELTSSEYMMKEMSHNHICFSSLISTPPPERVPIRTHLSAFSKGKVIEAIKYELARGGQVFYVLPRIKGKIKLLFFGFLGIIRACTICHSFLLVMGPG